MIVFVVSQRGRPLAVLAQARSTKKDSVRLELNIFTALKPLLFTWETRHWNTQQMRIFIKAINTPFVLCLTQNWNLKTCQGSWQVAYCHNGRWGKTVNTVVCEGTNQYWQVNVYFSCVFFIVLEQTCPSHFGTRPNYLITQVCVGLLLCCGKLISPWNKKQPKSTCTRDMCRNG